MNRRLAYNLVSSQYFHHNTQEVSRKEENSNDKQETFQEAKQKKSWRHGMASSFVFMQYKIPSAIHHPFSDFILRQKMKEKSCLANGEGLFPTVVKVYLRFNFRKNIMVHYSWFYPTTEYLCLDIKFS